MPGRRVTTAPGSRMSAQERRAAVLRAAVVEFAKGGYAGTSTEAVAARAEISQPYLFRLFGTKRDLFVATMAVMNARIEEAFRTAAGTKSGIEAMAAMAAAYQEMLQERDLLLVQLHSYAASEDEVIRAAARHGFRHLWTVVGELTAQGVLGARLRPRSRHLLRRPGEDLIPREQDQRADPWITKLVITHYQDRDEEGEPR